MALAPGAAAFGAHITVDNVNEALPIALRLLNQHGVESESRGIKTIKMRGPVTTIYRNPTRRVLFDATRDANPFFHLMESFWILAGSNRLKPLEHFLPSYRNFSDDGVTLHGAYGYRLRQAFGFDQLEWAITLLREKPDTRQCVLSMWHPAIDLGVQTKDVPCNDMIMFGIEDRRLNMTVCNRSNDAIWGAYGANAVHFSMLQEWVAVMVGCEVGWYSQQSNNFHVYPDNPFWGNFVSGNHEHGDQHNYYMSAEVQPYPLALTAAEAQAVYADSRMFVDRVMHDEQLSAPYRSPYFNDVVCPMLSGFRLYKEGLHVEALKVLSNVAAADWRVAAQEWVLRRKERADAAKASAR